MVWLSKPEIMTIHLYYHSIESAGIAFVIVLAVSALRANPKHFNTRIFVLLLASIVCFFIRTRQEYAYWMPVDLRVSEGFLALPMDVLMNAFSGLFMIYAFFMFRENQKFPHWLLWLFLLQLSLVPFAHLFTRTELSIVDTMLGIEISDFLFYNRLMGLLQTVFAVSALYWTIADWRADLVEGRRRLRWAFLSFQAFFSIFQNLMYTFIVPQNQYIAYQVHVGIVTVWSLTAFLLVLVNFKMDQPFAFGSIDRKPETKIENNSEHLSKLQQDRDWQKFNQSFEIDHIYREPGLSIGSLAQKLSMPEYRLRKLINERLGYRNFNVLLHEHRIKEACEALSDSDQAHLPILTIALTVGYQSINPFNRAFRELNNVTPSEYCMRALSSRNA